MSAGYNHMAGLCRQAITIRGGGGGGLCRQAITIRRVCVGRPTGGV